MGSLIAAAKLFPEQVSQDAFFNDVFYTLCGLALVVGVLAIGIIDTAIVRPKNRLDTWVQKIVASMIAGASFLIIGFAIWMWQFYDAFGVKNPLGSAISDWWLAGSSMAHAAQFFDPAASGHFNSEIDVFRVFLVFFIGYMMFAAALLHGAGIERTKASVMYILSGLLGGIVIPVILYYTWGSLSPLTNRGLHDYVGVFGLYVVVGVWALILAWRVGPRLGAFKPHLRTTGPRPSDLSQAAIGVLVVAVAIPFIALGCGYLIPEAGYFGISMTTSDFGLVLINIFAAFFGGAISGAILAYRTRNAYWALLGPITGYIAGTAIFDVTRPWVMILVALPAPLIAYGTYRLLHRLKIDETKVVPLVLGTSIYAALMPGVVAAGTASGGFIGIEEGAFTFQHASISIGMQLAGLGVTLAIAVGTGLIFILGLEKTIGLRVSEEEELVGLDSIYWNEEPLGDIPGGEPGGVPGRPGEPVPAPAGTPVG
jgi:ammonia channel protein AmtB